jgi:hypothetical protein
MQDLIKALQIFAKYTDTRNPTHCSHDVLAVCHVTKDDMTAEDRKAVKALGFLWDNDDEYWYSFRFGSA